MRIRVATSAGLWTLGEQPRVELERRRVAALAAGDGTLWALVDNELWQRGDRGWTRVVEIAEGRANCLLPLAGRVLVGTSEAHIVSIADGRAERWQGFENAEGRDEWYTPWGGPPDVRSLAARDSQLLANVHVGGILVSGDDGATWSQTIDIHADVHQVVADDLVLAATARGLASSADARSWSFHAEGLHATYARAVARAGEWVLMSASVGPHGGRAAVYRRSIAGEGSFERCREGLPDWFEDNIDTGCLAARGRVAAFATSDGRVFVSEDAGASWREVADSLPSARWVMLD